MMKPQWKTYGLLAALTALLLWIGQALGGAAGIWLAGGFALLMNFGAYWWSDKMVLRMHHAEELTPDVAPELYRTTAELARRAGVPMPRLYLIPEEAPNAFATGRNPEHGVVAITEGLLRTLTRNEIAGVIAHEIGHIKHRDTLLMSIAATLAGALSMIGNFVTFGSLSGGSQGEEEESANPLGGLLAVLVAPFAALLIQMAISRTREFLADEAAGRWTGNPLALASALRKIERWSQEAPMHTGSPATAHLYIQNPFTGGGLAKLFSTHPPTEERITRLEALARTAWAA
jgi:heat shock protein HtpX